MDCPVLPANFDIQPRQLGSVFGSAEEYRGQVRGTTATEEGTQTWKTKRPRSMASTE